MAFALFISYRRDDTQGHALDLYKSLRAHFRAKALFFDGDDGSIGAGDDFLDRIDQAVAEARVVLALIGHGWAQARDAAGRRRLQLDDDVVRRELRAALAGGARVIPVLFDGAPMPAAADLPPDLAPLATRHAFALPREFAAREAALAQLVALIAAVPGVEAARRVVVRPLHERRLEALRRHYLGAPAAQQVPAFVGRRAELDALDAWLADARGAPHLLLHGPAAIGKTSLLLHWLRAHAADARWHIVFLPISVRFDTNSPELFWALAAAQLGAQLTAARPNADDALDLALAALDRLEEDAVPLLIVIDGLDEAGGWKLPPEFSRRAWPGLRWLVGVRSAGDGAGLDRWLAELGWRRDAGTRLLALAPLGRQAVLAAVAEQARRSVAADADDATAAALASAQAWSPVAEELWRVCAGDPLLLGYHLDDLADATAAGTAGAPAMLARLRAAVPGFARYFSDWLAEQRPYWQAEHGRDDALDALLALLAQALGPLPLASLQTLLQTLHGERGAALSRSRLAPLRGFVIESDAGYTLAHPRLAEALAAEFGAQGLLMRRAQAALLAWCRAGGAALAAEGAAAGMARDAGADYIVRHFAQHLAQSPAAAADFMVLAREPWLRASLTLDESGRQLMADLALARHAVAERASATDPLPAWRLWLALARASVQTRARVEPELLVAFARLGHHTPAQVLRRLELMAPRERTIGAVRLAALLPADERAPLIAQALDMARRIGDFRERMRVWPQVTAAIADAASRVAAEGELLDGLDQAPHLYGWLEAVDAMAPHLSLPTQRRLLAMVLAHIGDHTRWDILDALWRHLPRALHDEGMAAVAAHAARLGPPPATPSVAANGTAAARVSAHSAQLLFEDAPTAPAALSVAATPLPAAPDRGSALPDAVLGVLFADLGQAERDACWQRLLAHARRGGDQAERARAFGLVEPWLLAQGRGARVRAVLARFHSEYRNEYARMRTYADIGRGPLSEATGALLRRQVLLTLQAMSPDALRVRYAPIACALLGADERAAYARGQLLAAPDRWRWKELAALVDLLPVAVVEAARAQATALRDGAEAALAEAVLHVHAGALADAPALDAALARLVALGHPGSDEVYDTLVAPLPPAQRVATFGAHLPRLAGDARTLAVWHPDACTPAQLLAAIDRPNELANPLALARHRDRLQGALGPERAAEEINSLLWWNEVDAAAAWLQALPAEHARGGWERLEQIAAAGVHRYCLRAACYLMRRDRALDPGRAAARYADLRRRMREVNPEPTIEQAAWLLEFASDDDRARLVAVLQATYGFDLEFLAPAWPHLQPAERAALLPQVLGALRQLTPEDADAVTEWLLAGAAAPGEVERALLDALPALLAEAPRSTWLRVIARRAPLWRRWLGPAGLRELATGLRDCAAALP